MYEKHNPDQLLEVRVVEPMSSSRSENIHSGVHQLLKEEVFRGVYKENYPKYPILQLLYNTIPDFQAKN